MLSDSETLREAAIEFLKHERNALPLAYVAGQLVRLAKCGAGWPVATESDWIAELETMRMDGLFLASAVGYRLNRKRIVEVETVDCDGQGRLF